MRLGPRQFRLEMLATQLDNLPMWDSGFLSKRFLSAHRLVVTPSDQLAFALTESAVYGDNGEPNRFFEPWFLNPVNLWVLPNFNHIKSVNSLWAGDASYRLRNGLRLATQIYIDDIQVDRGEKGRKPAQWGYTFLATGGAIRGALSWSALYTRVNALNYRTQANEERYTIWGVGLARSHADYDQWTARVTTAAAPRMLVTGELTMLRQGEGDILKRFPPDSLWADSLDFLTGTVERTVRLAAQAAWTPLDGVHLTADVGRHFLHNAGHVPGGGSGRWVWRVRAEIRRRLTGGLTW